MRGLALALVLSGCAAWPRPSQAPARPAALSWEQACEPSALPSGGADGQGYGRALASWREGGSRPWAGWPVACHEAAR